MEGAEVSVVCEMWHAIAEIHISSRAGDIQKRCQPPLLSACHFPVAEGSSKSALRVEREEAAPGKYDPSSPELVLPELRLWRWGEQDVRMTVDAVTGVWGSQSRCSTSQDLKPGMMLSAFRVAPLFSVKTLWKRPHTMLQ